MSWYIIFLTDRERRQGSLVRTAKRITLRSSSMKLNGKFLSFKDATKSSCASQIALFDTSGGPTYLLRTKAIFEIELQLVEYLQRNGV